MASLAEIMISLVGTVPMSIRSAVHRGLDFYGFSPQWRLRKQGRNLAQLNIDTQCLPLRSDRSLDGHKNKITQSCFAKHFVFVLYLGALALSA